ncbi:MAG: phospholipase D-like domain-containing protein [Chloroflexota bacterium]
MQIQMVDNVERNTASVLVPAIETANDIRIAVAFVSSDGLSQIMPSVHMALEAGAYVEFLVGMDSRATDPSAIRDLYTLFQKTSLGSLLCFASRRTSAIYHPKMYLARDSQTATAIIGSSNLTRRGLVSNIEANVVIKEDIRAEIVSEIYSTYNRLKYHPDRVLPDDEFIDLFAELCQKEKSREHSLERDSELQELKETFVRKANKLQRPKPTRADLIGWLELVYDALPEGRFTNQDIYAYEDEFSRHYPQNLNIKAKIRQQLQFLHKLGFIEHPSKGVWKKLV